MFFFKYSDEELFRDLIAPGKTTVVRGLKELKKLNLIEKKDVKNAYYLTKKDLEKKITHISNNNITSNNNKINNNKITTSDNKIINFLVENNVNQRTIRNILKLENIDFEKIKSVIMYAKKKKWGGGAIYRALQENWVLSSSREDFEKRVSNESSEELEEKRKWLNYFGGIDKVMKLELLEVIRTIPIKKLTCCKSELCRMTPKDFRTFLLNLSKKYM